MSLYSSREEYSRERKNKKKHLTRIVELRDEITKDARAIDCVTVSLDRTVTNFTISPRALTILIIKHPAIDRDPLHPRPPNGRT